MKHFDVIIVGAGPAGSHLAYLLARDGLNVAIIDRDAFPRDKVCGGGLTRKTVEHLGIDLAPVVERQMRGALITWRNQSTIIKDVAVSPGCMVLRSRFDDFLLQRARQAGAAFFPETAFVDVVEQGGVLEVATNRRALRAPWLVAADGVGSAVRGRVFGKQAVDYVPALEALVEVDAAVMEPYAQRALFDLGGMARGYGWIFPKGDHLNVGVYSPFGSTGLKSELARFLSCYPALAHPRSVKYKGYAIPVRNRRNQFVKDRVWLVGDAAGLAESVFGEGIYFALKSATLAAQAFRGAGSAPDGACYSRSLARELLPELRASRWIGKALYSFQRFSFTHLACHPRINDHFAGLITGEVGYRECLRRTALAWPRWVATTSYVGAT